MLHARKDYNERVQDSKNIIGDDEPVFLLRAKDKLMVPILYDYLNLLRQLPGHDDSIEFGVLRHIERTIKWQAIHGIKNPDTPLIELKD